MMKLLHVSWAGAFVCVLAIFPVAGLVANSAVDAWRIDNPTDPKNLEGRRAEFEFDAPDKNAPNYDEKVAGIYGTPVGKPSKFVFVSKEKLIRPKEKPELVLLPVDTQKGEGVIEVTAVYFFRKYFALGATGVGVVLYLIWIFFSRRAPSQAPAA